MTVDPYVRKDKTDIYIYSYVCISTVLELSLDCIQSFCNDVTLHTSEINDSVNICHIMCMVLTICVPTYVYKL